ncbi:UNKNOWN [Stylonychia lemnae]|uniref:Uncharacterized protein n=1 Tax=Stylonychia lemnae TaxID=5949 RepID=A0A078AA88_STYLE|nr:UNKNOWN [Stylonychia lemnae]|eukprot:CDW79109.1 UNKNOWN [Stylonychia lemnae]
MNLQVNNFNNQEHQRKNQQNSMQQKNITTTDGADSQVNQYTNRSNTAKGTGRNNKEKESLYQTPDQDGNLRAYNEIDDSTAEDQRSGIKQSKKKNKQSFNKNFMEMNKQVKTLKEIYSENSQKKKERMSEVMQRKSQNSWMGVSMMLTRKESPSRASDWNSMQLKQKLMEQQPSQTGAKNQSNTFIIDHETAANNVEAKQMNAFSTNPKEKAWFKTNASEIMQLSSVKTLDVPKGEESAVLPCKKNGVQDKHNLNYSKAYENSNYVKEGDIPDQYKSHREVKPVVHNINNHQVQSQRLKNLSSNVF